MHDIHKEYGGKIRVRVCGVCIENEEILLVRHQGLGTKGVLWIPPGGGIEIGETATAALTREFKEETGLDITVENLLFVNEFIHKPLHAIELFFKVKKTGGNLKTGYDPEMKRNAQLIDEVRFVTFEELRIMDKETLHQALQNVQSAETLLNMKGNFKFYR